MGAVAAVSDTIAHVGEVVSNDIITPVVKTVEDVVSDPVQLALVTAAVIAGPEVLALGETAGAAEAGLTASEIAGLGSAYADVGASYAAADAAAAAAAGTGAVASAVPSSSVVGTDLGALTPPYEYIDSSTILPGDTVLNGSPIDLLTNPEVAGSLAGTEYANIDSSTVFPDTTIPEEPIYGYSADTAVGEAVPPPSAVPEPEYGYSADTAVGEAIPPPSASVLPDLSPTQLAQILKTGLGLFGGIGAGVKALQGLTPTPSLSYNYTNIPSVTPFTGTFSGMNPYSPGYFQEVQQNYNRLFPTAPADIATPLESWYNTKFVPDTSISKKLFGV
jgi:hypothetical protein